MRLAVELLAALGSILAPLATAAAVEGLATDSATGLAAGRSGTARRRGPAANRAAAESDPCNPLVLRSEPPRSARQYALPC